MKTEQEEISEEHLDALSAMVKNSTRASELSDGDLIDEVLARCGFDVLSYEEALIDELTQRFQNLKNKLAKNENNT